jgi:hypothetical protein
MAKPPVRIMHTRIEPGARVRYCPALPGIKSFRATVIAPGLLLRSWIIQSGGDTLRRTVPTPSLKLIGQKQRIARILAPPRRLR